MPIAGVVLVGVDDDDVPVEPPPVDVGAVVSVLIPVAVPVAEPVSVAVAEPVPVLVAVAEPVSVAVAESVADDVALRSVEPEAMMKSARNTATTLIRTPYIKRRMLRANCLHRDA